MLANRVTRLITVALLAIATIAASVTLGGDVLGSSSSFIISMLSCYVIGILYQVCADF